MVIAVLANMFNVTVHARQYACTVVTTSPHNGHVTIEGNRGLLMQYHFVGLDK